LIVSLLSTGIGVLMLQEIGINLDELKKLKQRIPEFSVYTAMKNNKKIINDYREKKLAAIEKKYNITNANSEELSAVINPHQAVGGKGLIVICSKNSLGKVVITKQDEEKRYLLLVFEHEKQIFIVANVYGPASGCKDNNEFFENFTHVYKHLVNEVRQKYPQKEVWEIVAGDFNAKFDESMDKKVTKHNKLKHWEGLINFQDAAKLRDIWREQYPTERQFTWIKQPSQPEESQETRIDHILSNIPSSYILKINIVEFNNKMSKDHKAVQMQLNVVTTPYEKMTSEFVPRFKTEVNTGEVIRQRLKLAEMPSRELENLALFENQRYQRTKFPKGEKEPGDLEKVAIPSSDDETSFEIEMIKKKIKEIENRIAKRKLFRNKSKVSKLVDDIRSWESKKPSRFFEKA